MNIPTIVVTSGEPASIAPDVCIKIAQQSWQANIVFITNTKLLKERAELINSQIDFIEITSIKDAPQHKKNIMVVLNQELPEPCKVGQLSPLNSPFVLNSIKMATEFCLTKQADAMVTPPVHKGVINEFGLAFTGHTEFVANICQAKPVMMLACDKMRVALATTHLPLKDVADAISIDSISEIIEIINDDLIHKFNIKKPCIFVCGLNPHAGEEGHLGLEEIEIIQPALNNLKRKNINVVGPLAADTLFNPENLKEADAILAMYHDQGLPVLKYASFGVGINITLGLPIIRVSVDHGTALDLAGSNLVKSTSMNKALELAIELSTN